MTSSLEMLSTKELAQELKRSELTLTRWRRQRKGPPYKILRGRVLYAIEDVKQWLAEQGVAHAQR